MSVEYPLTPFTDFAVKGDPYEFVSQDEQVSWTRHPEAPLHPAAGNYEGAGEDNPFSGGVGSALQALLDRDGPA